MTPYDDSWRDSYDAWKTRGPDEYDDFEPDHDCSESFRIDAENVAHCVLCGETWWPDADEKAAWLERQAEDAAWYRRQRRREFWRKVTLPIRWPIDRLLERIWPRQATRVLTDDEVPF